MISRRWFSAVPIAMAVAGLVALPAGALASAVPGATYTGKASDGAIVTLTVSSDGTTVTSYSVLGIYGTDSNGRMCQDSSSLGPTGWAGAPISNESFQSSIEDTLFSIEGAFGASQSISGTFQLAIPPTQNGGAGCSTGSVTWTATVAAASGSGGNGGGGGSGSSGGGGNGSSGGGGNGSSGGSGGGGGATGPPKKIQVRVMFRRAAHARFDGALKATTASCTARRTVYLWAGHRRLGSSRSSAKGAFQFKERKAWHGRRVHASVTVLSTKAGTCTAGSSATIRG